MAACAECGYEYESLDHGEILDAVPALAGRHVQLLSSVAADRLRAHPRAGSWSALEYGCHVRDVFRIYDERLKLMLTTTGPHYPNWDQDATAVADRYAEQDPGTVAAEIVAAGTALAARFDTVTGDQWQRTGFRSDGASFTIETFARYFVHDPVHHYHDVTG